jgi:hypothetical protein
MCRLHGLPEVILGSAEGGGGLLNADAPGVKVIGIHRSTIH